MAFGYERERAREPFKAPPGMHRGAGAMSARKGRRCAGCYRPSRVIPRPRNNGWPSLDSASKKTRRREPTIPHGRRYSRWLVGLSSTTTASAWSQGRNRHRAVPHFSFEGWCQRPDGPFLQELTALDSAGLAVQCCANEVLSRNRGYDPQHRASHTYTTKRPNVRRLPGRQPDQTQ